MSYLLYIFAGFMKNGNINYISSLLSFKASFMNSDIQGVGLNLSGLESGWPVIIWNTFLLAGRLVQGWANVQMGYNQEYDWLADRWAYARVGLYPEFVTPLTVAQYFQLSQITMTIASFI